LYNVVDLGYLPNSNSSTTGSMGLGIDDAGEAAASSNISVNVTHGAFWNGTTLSDIDPTHPTADSFVLGMGPNGQVLGETGSGFGFVWTGGPETPLSNIDPAHTGAAYGMNSLGDVVGSDTESSLVVPVVWKSGGSPTALNTPANPLNMNSPYFSGSAAAINSSRTIVGASFGPSNDAATLWSYNSGTGSWTPQLLVTPTATSGSGSDARDVNTAGNIVGNFVRSNGHGTGGFIWHPGDTAFTDLDPTDSLGNTFAKGINDNNEVVGVIGNYDAFVWDLVPAFAICKR
jgi:hypothetical protein